VGFEQATIKVENEKEFEELKGAIERTFRPEKVEAFLKQVQSKGATIRDLEKILSESLLERVDEVLAKSGNKARELYDSLSLSDQAQMREFYLSKLESVDTKLRHRFKKLYRYY